MLNKILNLIKKILPKKMLAKLLPSYHFCLAKLSALIYNYPSEKMLIIGVTGTAGKSSTCYFIAQILEAAGFKVGMTTTTLFKIGAREWLNDKKMTMLGRMQTQKLLHQMVKEKCLVAIVETSSQGIEQFRHIGINYDILVLTNLYPEHIEAHGGFENYKNAKGKLFDIIKTLKHKSIRTIKQNADVSAPSFLSSNLPGADGTGASTESGGVVNKIIIINGDDENAEYFLNFPADKKITYGTNSLADIKLENLKINLLGEYNKYNVLAGVSVAKVLNISDEQIKKAVVNLKPLPGRLEFIANNRGIKILVDYAFEPEALKKLYTTIKDVPHNKIIHVLGAAGGGRDAQKRPKMGALAAQNSEVVIITNEDPYDEDPLAIIKDVTQGAADYLVKTFGTEKDAENFKFLILNFKINLNFSILNNPKKLFAILDRREAIKKALEEAQENDLFLITGKGAEQAICVENGKMIQWDDRVVVREELKQF